MASSAEKKNAVSGPIVYIPSELVDCIPADAAIDSQTTDVLSEFLEAVTPDTYNAPSFSEFPDAVLDFASTTLRVPEIPFEFVDTISGVLMQDPVSTVDGNTFERVAIVQWFANGHITSPLTGASLGSTALVPNHFLKQAIAQFLERTPVLRPSSNSFGHLAAAIAHREMKVEAMTSQKVVGKHQYELMLRQLRRANMEVLHLRERLGFLEKQGQSGQSQGEEGQTHNTPLAPTLNANCGAREDSDLPSTNDKGSNNSRWSLGSLFAPAPVAIPADPKPMPKPSAKETHAAAMTAIDVLFGEGPMGIELAPVKGATASGVFIHRLVPPSLFSESSWATKYNRFVQQKLKDPSQLLLPGMRPVAVNGVLLPKSADETIRILQTTTRPMKVKFLPPSLMDFSPTIAVTPPRR